MIPNIPTVTKPHPSRRRLYIYGAAGIIAIFVVGVSLHIARTAPSHDRTWSPDQAVLPAASFDGDEITIHNVRNFRYEDTTTWHPAYEDRTYTLSDLDSVWYIVEPFGTLGAAHTFLSFGFRDGEHIAISIEIRKQAGQTFSAFRGLFRSYELMYVIADERDVIDLRSRHRANDIYLYPITIPPAAAQDLFVAMLDRTNEIAAQPEFYNTLTNNCTNNIVHHINAVTEQTIPINRYILLPAHSDKLALELGLIDTTHTLIEDVRDQYRIVAGTTPDPAVPDYARQLRRHHYE